MIDKIIKDCIDEYVMITAAETLVDEPERFDDDSGRWYKTTYREAISEAATLVYNNPVDFVGEPLKKDLTLPEIESIKQYVWDNYM